MPSDVSTATGDHSVEALRRELAEAREQQAATAEILAAIASSVTDVNQVFAKIAASAARLCDAHDATIFQVDGNDLRIVANHGKIPPGGALHLTRAIVTGCAVLDRRTIHVADLHAESKKYPEGSDRARLLGHRTILAVPLIHAGEAIGAIAIRRTEVRPFTDRQVELLKAFADQAVIAIENTRLFETVQSSKRDLQESLDYQTASAEVLSVISRSPNQLQPVLDTITQTAARLCQADYAHFRLLRDGTYHVASSNNYDPLTLKRLTPIAPGPGSITGRVALECKTVHLPDILTDTTGDYSRQYGEVARTALGVPLVKDQMTAGVIMLFRKTVRPFTERQIALVNTFAEQALIAMENTRLFEEVQARTGELAERTQELTETLEYQTATSEVLGVISKSPNSVHPVFEAIITMAERLCGGDFGFVYRLENDGNYHLVAAPRASESYRTYRAAHPVAPGDESIMGRALLERRAIHVADVKNDPEQTEIEAHRRGNIRSALAAPLISAGKAIGVMGVVRSTARPFSQRQLALIETFADQAVIAIENARLFEAEQASKRELQESLEYQTATSEVLKVISRSPNELQPVLDTILETAQRLCRSDRAQFFLLDDGTYRLAAHKGTNLESLKLFLESPISAETATPSITGKAARERRTIHVPDVAADTELAR